MWVRPRLSAVLMIYGALACSSTTAETPPGNHDTTPAGQTSTGNQSSSGAERGSGGAESSGGQAATGGAGATGGALSSGGSDQGGSGQGGSGGTPASTPLVMGYVFDQTGGTADLDQLDYDAVDYVVHAFITANATTGLIVPVGQFDAYRQAGIVGKVHAAGKKIVFSAGGAADSYPLKLIAKDATLTAAFADDVVAKINGWGYDGIDLDIEFPFGGDEPQEHLNLVTAVYNKVKANNPAHVVLFGISPGYLLAEYKWPQLNAVSDFGFYFCYDWSNPANGPIKNPGVTLTMFGGDTIEASCRGALNYILAAGYPAHKLIAGLPFYANGGAPWHSAPVGIDAITPHPDYMEVNSDGYWTTPTAMGMKIDAVLDPASSVLTGSAVLAGVGWWQWGHESVSDPALSQAIKLKLGK